MMHTRLVGLATITIEYEITGKLNLKELSTKQLKARKVMFESTNYFFIQEF